MFNLLILDVILIIGTSDRTPLTAAPFGDIAARMFLAAMLHIRSSLLS
ncbi:MAG TPA: hypothetical protein VFH01_00350 [Pyrinomonadaceae bacterium]|nr:hypothetical protein [Pyrinomonadaceae bacterium]